MSSPAKTTREGADLLAHLAAAMTASMQARGIDEATAVEAATETMESLGSAFTGQMVYFPALRHRSDVAAELAEQAVAMVDAGHSLADVAARFGYSTSWVYKAIYRVRAKRKAAREATAAEQQAQQRRDWKGRGN